MPKVRRTNSRLALLSLLDTQRASGVSTATLTKPDLVQLHVLKEGGLVKEELGIWTITWRGLHIVRSWQPPT